MLKQLLQLNRDYREAKEKAFEQGVNVFESKTNPLFVVLFLTLSIIAWLYAVFIPDGFEKIYETQGTMPLIIFFVISYFFTFLGSRIIFKPTAEELEDDTSSFALFSACGRKEFRSLISIGFSLFHTFLFVFYLVNKDIKWF